jgi:CDP-2,3-bis-(O-geranylgeranyl)-sn-glycerol synthase
VPVDFGAKWRGKEIFGPNKTWRGIIVGIFTGAAVALIQALLFFNVEFFRNNTLVDYSRINFFVFGSLMGAGALAGDLLKSFIKRRLSKPPGRPWFPWDQLDWIFGAMLAGSIVYIPPAGVAAVTALLYVCIHLCSDRIVCRMGIKKREDVN